MASFSQITGSTSRSQARSVIRTDGPRWAGKSALRALWPSSLRARCRMERRFQKRSQDLRPVTLKQRNGFSLFLRLAGGNSSN